MKGIKIAPCSSTEVFDFSGKCSSVKNSCLYAKLAFKGREIETTFFHELWKDIAWPDPGLSWDIAGVQEKNGLYETDVTFKTDKYARMVNVKIAGQDTAEFSDNFFDMTDESVKTVRISASMPFSREHIIVNHWLTRGHDAE